MTRQNAPLGTISVDQFMREYWQRKPLLVRQALPGFISPIGFDEVLAFARNPDAESRLVSAFDGQWALARGPFGARQIPSRRRPHWTVLVQGMDLHHEAAHDMLARFRFLADARLDDLMVSVATDGGGVGPHLDSYDVFLIQAQGRRRWRVAPPGDARLRPDLPLKILQHFEPEHDWVLEPGDLLYLPPGWGHDGVAQGECMTWSVGFRAPSRREVLAAWFAELAEQPVEGPDPRFGDAGVAASRHPGRLPTALQAQMREWVTGFQPSPRSIDAFIGRFLTEPKNGVWFEGPDPLPGLASFIRQAKRRGLRLDRRSRMVYRAGAIYLNGEAFEASPSQRPLLRALADDRHLPGRVLTAVDARVASTVFPLLHDWFDAGWIGWGS